MGKVAGEEVVVDGDVLQADGFAKGLNPPRITVTQLSHTHSCHTHTQLSHTGQAHVMRGGCFESIDASTAAAAGAATPEPKDNRPRHYGKKTKQHEGLTRNMVRV